MVSCLETDLRRIATLLVTAVLEIRSGFKEMGLLRVIPPTSISFVCFAPKRGCVADHQRDLGAGSLLLTLSGAERPLQFHSPLCQRTSRLQVRGLQASRSPVSSDAPSCPTPVDVPLSGHSFTDRPSCLPTPRGLTRSYPDPPLARWEKGASSDLTSCTSAAAVGRHAGRQRVPPPNLTSRSTSSSCCRLHRDVRRLASCNSSHVPAPNRAETSATLPLPCLITQGRRVVIRHGSRGPLACSGCQPTTPAQPYEDLCYHRQSQPTRLSTCSC